MSETVIRINKRVVERTIFVIIILIMGAFLVFGSSGGDTSALEEELSSLQADNDNLQEELNQVQSQLSLAQTQLDAITSLEETSEEATVEEETEETPESVEEEEVEEFVISWNVDSDDGKLANAIAIFENNGDSSEEFSYHFYWDGFQSDYDGIRADVFVPEQGRETVVLYDGSGFLSTPPSNIDTIALDVEDSDGTQIARLTEEIR